MTDKKKNNKQVNQELSNQVEVLNNYLANVKDNDVAIDRSSSLIRSDGSSYKSVFTDRAKFDGTRSHTMTDGPDNDTIKHRISACREAYEQSGIIGNVIDLMVDFALEDITISHPSKPIENFFRRWANKVKLKKIAGMALKSYFRDGNTPILSYKDTISPAVIQDFKKFVSSKSGHGNFGDIKKGKKSLIPYAYQVLDTMKLYKQGEEMLNNVTYEYLVVPRDNSTVLGQVNNVDVDAIRENIIKTFGPGAIPNAEDFSNSGRILLPPNQLTMLYYKRDGFSRWANPMLWRVIDDLKFKSLLRDMDISVCESVMTTLTFVLLGDVVGGFPTDPKIISNMASLLKNPAKSKTIVWNDLLKVIAEYPPVDKILGEEKYKQVDSDIRSALGISEVLINGEGKNFSNSFLSVKTLTERLEGGRSEVSDWINSELMQITKAMRFTTPPVLQFKHMSLVDEQREKELMLELVDRGVISYQTVTERFGENMQVEISRMKSEDVFREKNKEKYPFTLIKLGKFGPQVQGDQEQKASPMQQGDKGKDGGRPAGTKKPKKNQTTPKAPIGQKTAKLSAKDLEFAENLYMRTYNLLGDAFKNEYGEITEELIDKISISAIKVISLEYNVSSLDKRSLINILSDKMSNEKEIIQSKMHNQKNKIVQEFINKNNKHPDAHDMMAIVANSYAVIKAEITND